MRGLFQGSHWLGNAQLPNPPIMEGILVTIENAIREAWTMVLETFDSTDIQVKDAYEDQLTAELCKHLDRLRLQDPPLIPGFSPAFFESVQRESNWSDYQNSSIDKQPDLVFKFYGKRPGVEIDSAYYDGLFVECKPVDAKHSIQGHYLDKGLSRFVNGTYAWAMQDAMMLGYTDDTTNLYSKLILALLKPSVQKSLNMNGSPAPCQGDKIISVRCETQHSREWKYQHNGAKAGPIRIRHVWLGHEKIS